MQFLFGGLPVATKIALQYLTPLELMLVRTFFAAIIFALAGRLYSRAPRVSTNLETRKERLKRHLLLFSMALCGASLNQYLLFLGIAAGSAVVAAIVVPAIPLFTVILATLSGRESFHPVKLLAAGIGIFGVLILFIYGIHSKIKEQDYIAKDETKQDKFVKKMAYLGLSLIIMGFILQLLGNIIK